MEQTKGQAQGQGQAQVINTTPAIKSEDLISPIKFAEILGKPAQYIYQMLRDKKFPIDTYVIVKAGDKERPMLLKTAALNWFNNRPTRSASSSSSAVHIAANPDEIIARMVDMFKQVAAENPKNQAINQLAEGLDRLMSSVAATTEHTVASTATPADIAQ